MERLSVLLFPVRILTRSIDELSTTLNGELFGKAETLGLSCRSEITPQCGSPSAHS